jgi:hypothetical protein
MSHKYGSSKEVREKKTLHWPVVRVRWIKENGMKFSYRNIR